MSSIKPPILGTVDDSLLSQVYLDVKTAQVDKGDALFQSYLANIQVEKSFQNVFPSWKGQTNSHTFKDFVQRVEVQRKRALTTGQPPLPHLLASFKGLSYALAMCIPSFL